MGIRNRRQGREAALQALYARDIGGVSLNQSILDAQEASGLSEGITEFAKRLVFGISDNARAIDETISAALIDWRIDRLAPIDRNLLRIGVFELLHCPEIPPAVTLNEAIELAKKYSTQDSGKFVNGVLGRVYEDSPKWNWVPAETTDVEEASVVLESPEIEEVEVAEGSEEAAELAKIGVWKLRSEPQE